MGSAALHAERSSVVEALLIGLAVSVPIGVAAATGKWTVPAAIGAAAGALVLLRRYPMIHWLAFFGIMPVYFRQSDVGVSLFDLGMAVYLALLLVGWLIYALTVARDQIVWERKDFLLWLGLGATVFSSFSALAHGVSLLDWAREWALIAMAGFYFLFRTTFATEKQFRIYAGLMVVLSVSLAVWGMINLRQQAVEALYAYQLRGFKGVNAVYLIGLFMSISLALYARSIPRRIGLLVLSVVIMGGIITSFTRTVWVGSAVALLAMIALLPMTQRLRLIAALSIGAVIVLTTLQILLGPVFPIFMQVVGARAETIKNVPRQASIIERRDESRRILHLLTRPDIALTGIGPGNRYVYYDSYLGKPIRTHFTHNGALGLLLKFGIPVGVFLYSFHLMMVAKSIRCYWRSRHTRWEPYVLPFTLALIGTTVMDFTTNAFFLRSGALFLAMLYAGIAIADRLLQQDKVLSLPVAVPAQ